MTDIGTYAHHQRSFDPEKTIKEEFGDDVIFIMVVDRKKTRVDLYHNKNATNSPDFPWNEPNVKMKEPDQITVLDTESSPGCKTIIINGRAYEKC